VLFRNSELKTDGNFLLCTIILEDQPFRLLTFIVILKSDYVLLLKEVKIFNNAWKLYLEYCGNKGLKPQLVLDNASTAVQMSSKKLRTMSVCFALMANLDRLQAEFTLVDEEEGLTNSSICVLFIESRGSDGQAVHSTVRSLVQE